MTCFDGLIMLFFIGVGIEISIRLGGYTGLCNIQKRKFKTVLERIKQNHPEFEETAFERYVERVFYLFRQFRLGREYALIRDDLTKSYFEHLISNYVQGDLPVSEQSFDLTIRGDVKFIRFIDYVCKDREYLLVSIGYTEKTLTYENECVDHMQFRFTTGQWKLSFYSVGNSFSFPQMVG